MNIAVGSTNPVKVTAVRLTVERVWPEAQVYALHVPSGVRAMPMSNAETIAGARNRAIAARLPLPKTIAARVRAGEELSLVMDDILVNSVRSLARPLPRR